MRAGKTYFSSTSSTPSPSMLTILPLKVVPAASTRTHHYSWRLCTTITMVTLLACNVTYPTDHPPTVHRKKNNNKINNWTWQVAGATCGHQITWSFLQMFTQIRRCAKTKAQLQLWKNENRIANSIWFSEFIFLFVCLFEVCKYAMWCVQHAEHVSSAQEDFIGIKRNQKFTCPSPTVPLPLHKMGGGGVNRFDATFVCDRIVYRARALFCFDSRCKRRLSFD